MGELTAEAVPELRKLRPADIAQQDFEPVDPKVREQTLAIVEDVKTHKEEALLKYAWKFKELPEGDKKFLLSRDDLKEAFEALPAEQKGVLERTAERIRTFAKAQRASVQ